MENLLVSCDSLRSQVSRNGLLALKDCYRQVPNASALSEQQIDAQLKLLLKKVADTNAFIHESASAATIQLCRA